MSGGPALSFYEVLCTAQVDGTALNTSTTATSIIPSASRFVLPSNFFSQIGKRLRITAQGRMSTFTSGTLTIAVNFGTVASPIIVFTSGALAMVVSQTNVTFDMEINLTCRAIGSGTAANLMGVGRLSCAAVLSANSQLPITSPVVGTGFDATATQVVDLFATWSVSNAANSIQVHQYSVESLN